MYQRLVGIAGGDSIVLVPDSPLNKYSVAACFQKLAETNYVSFQGYLKCGHMGSRISLSPAPMVTTSIENTHCRLLLEYSYRNYTISVSALHKEDRL